MGKHIWLNFHPKTRNFKKLFGIFSKPNWKRIRDGRRLICCCMLKTVSPFYAHTTFSNAQTWIIFDVHSSRCENNKRLCLLQVCAIGERLFRNSNLIAEYGIFVGENSHALKSVSGNEIISKKGIMKKELQNW